MENEETAQESARKIALAAERAKAADRVRENLAKARAEDRFIQMFDKVSAEDYYEEDSREKVVLADEYDTIIEQFLDGTNN